MSYGGVHHYLSVAYGGYVHLRRHNLRETLANHDDSSNGQARIYSSYCPQAQLVDQKNSSASEVFAATAAVQLEY